MSRENDLSLTHTGWLIFSGLQGKHRPSKPDEFYILPQFSEIEGFNEVHAPEKYNSILHNKTQIAIYEQMLPSEEKESYYHNIPIGTLRIPEIIQLLRYVKCRYP